MTLKAYPTTINHLDNFEYKEVGFDVEKALEFSLNYPEIRPMMSFLTEENQIIFICGLSAISEGIWEAWLIPSIHINKYPIQTVKAMKDFTNWLLTDYPAHRVQIAVLDENVKWAKAIGFQFESIVKKYHSGKDHFMYVKVRN
jgi:hypothetical protein